MSAIYQDTEYQNLLWMDFDGTTWDEFNILLSQLIELSDDIEEPYCLIFNPLNDMPRGNPLPHIKRMTRFMEDEAKFEHMIAIVPKWMKIAAMFAKVTMQLIPLHRTTSNDLDSVVQSRDEALAVYRQYQTQKA